MSEIYYEQIGDQWVPIIRQKKRRARYRSAPKAFKINPVLLSRGLHKPPVYPTEWSPSIRVCRFCASSFLPTGMWDVYCQESCIKSAKESKKRIFAQRNILHRIAKLNKIANLPETNIGWDCFGCSLHSDDFRFFDVDHIKTRKHGGPNHVHNYQILCPNCHRIKTIADRLLGGGKKTGPKPKAQFPFSPADTGERVTVLESCQDGETAKVMRCEASNSAA